MNTLFTEFLKLALQEDLAPIGDITSNLFIDNSKSGILNVFARKQSGIMSGSEFVSEVYKILDQSIKVNFNINNGELITENAQIATIEGNFLNILRGERLFLNLLQTAISTATYTNKFVQKVKHTNVKILDTRKTIPCLRVLQKQAVLDGGGYNHRFNLSTGILIKDNHIGVVGDINKVLNKIQNNIFSHLNCLEIEADNLIQLEAILKSNTLSSRDVVLLDNFTLDDLKKAVQMVNKVFLLEASGGVNLDTVCSIAETGVDFISVGCITQSTIPFDIGLDFVL